MSVCRTLRLRSLPPSRSRATPPASLGKNHLGDLNKYLRTLHGFDEFFGYLYHLDAMEDFAHPAYPKELLDKVGPRNMVHSWATTTDDATVDPRRGKIGKQKIEDASTLFPKRMETVDDEILDLSLKFADKAQKDGKPFSSGSTRRACTSQLTCRRNTKPCARRPMAGRFRKPAWRSSTTSSARL